MFGEKKAPNSKLSEPKKIRKYGNADLYREEKVSKSKLSESKKIRKNGKVQKIQSPGVHKMKFKPSHKIADSQNTPIKSPNISCDSTVLDTGIPKSDSSKMMLEVQDTKQNYKTKSLKMSKGSVPQMPLVKRRENVVKSGKFKSQGCIKRSSNLN